MLAVTIERRAAVWHLHAQPACENPVLGGVDRRVTAARRRRALAMGDFNTCRAYVDEPGATDVTALFLDKIQDAGYRDVWRDRFPDGREYSWYSHRGNGFRIDHAFASSRLALSGSADIRYSHAERTSGLSDHSALIVEIGTA